MMMKDWDGGSGLIIMYPVVDLGEQEGKLERVWGGGGREEESG